MSGLAGGWSDCSDCSHNWGQDTLLICSHSHAPSSPPPPLYLLLIRFQSLNFSFHWKLRKRKWKYFTMLSENTLCRRDFSSNIPMRAELCRVRPIILILSVFVPPILCLSILDPSKTFWFFHPSLCKVFRHRNIDSVGVDALWAVPRKN